MTIKIINGPNLNLLGTREPEIYGNQSFEEFLEGLNKDFPDCRIDYFQSNSEGAVIDAIQACRQGCDGLIINAGAYSHSSPAIADALAAAEVPAVEVHISNIYKREAFRHHSFIAPKCIASISGMGLEGYRAAANFLLIQKNI